MILSITGDEREKIKNPDKPLPENKKRDPRKGRKKKKYDFPDKQNDDQRKAPSKEDKYYRLDL